VSARAELALLILQMLDSGEIVPTQDAFQLRMWLLRLKMPCVRSKRSRFLFY
jgi:hypothetical protein